MDDFKSLEYQFNDFEEDNIIIGDSRQGQDHSNIPSQSQSRQMESQRKPNFGALLNARQCGGGFKPQSFENSRETHRVPVEADSHRPNPEKEASSGPPYPDWVMKAGMTVKSGDGKHDTKDQAYDQDNTTRNQMNNAACNGVRTKERVHIRSGSAQNTENNDDINQLLSKLKVEHRFNDWQTVEQKLRQVFEEDRMKSKELNGNSGGTRGQLDSAGTNRVRFSEPLASNLPENLDQYANLETYKEHMVNNPNPNLAAKWGQLVQGQDQHGETMDTTSNINKTKGTRRNKNVRGSKNVNPKPGTVEMEHRKSADQADKTDQSATETTGKGGTTNVGEDSSGEDESSDEEGHLNQWVEEAKEWGKDHGFPDPTPSDQSEQSGQDKEQSLIQQLTQIPMLGGKGRCQTGMPMAGLGKSFLGGQGEGQLQQQLAGGGIPSMFGALSGQQGRQGLGQANAYAGQGYGGAAGLGSLGDLLGSQNAGGLGRGGGRPPMIPLAQGQGQGRGQGRGQLRGQGRGHGGSGMGGGEEDFDPTNFDRNSSEYLQQVVAYESFKAKNNTCAKSDGMCTVLIVDTSSSVTDEPMIEIGQFLREFLNGVEANKSKHQLHENIAVITVGPEGEVLQHLTTDYDRIRTAMDSMQFEGPNPLFSGFILVQSVLSGHTTLGISKLNGHAVRPRVILLSSGFLSGKAEGQWRQQNETQQMLCGEMVQSLAESLMIQLYCVQVGNANKDFLDSVSTMTGGKLMTPEDAKLMSRCYIHHRVAASLRQTGGTDLSDRSSIKSLLVKDIQEYSDADVTCVIEILKQGEPDLQERDRRMQQMMEVSRQQQAQQGQVNEVQKMEQIQQLLGAMQGQGDEGLVDLLGQLQQGAPGGGNMEELLRSVQSMQAGGGLGSMGGMGAAGRGGGVGGGMPFPLGSGGGLPQGLGGGLPPQLGGGGMPPQGMSASMLSQLGRGLGMPPQLGQGNGMPPRQSIPAGFYRGQAGQQQGQANGMPPGQSIPAGFYRGQASQQQGSERYVNPALRKWMS